VAFAALVGRGMAGRPTQWELENTHDLSEIGNAFPIDATEVDEDIDEAEDVLEQDQDLARVLGRLEREGEVDEDGCWLCGAIQRFPLQRLQLITPVAFRPDGHSCTHL
jgi:hypothetical protein